MRILAAMVAFARVLVPALFLLLVPLTTTWAAGGLSVTTPNGGQKWTIGKQYLIKWRKGTAGTSVRISLTKSGRHYKWISKKTRNDGRYTWRIPTSVAAGSAYKIKIKSVKKKKVLDASNRAFTIIKSDNDDGDKKSARVAPTSLVQQATTVEEAAKKRQRKVAMQNRKAVMHATTAICSKIKKISIGPTFKVSQMRASWTTTDCSPTREVLRGRSPPPQVRVREILLIYCILQKHGDISFIHS